jgi:SAM-dependent methyltransferase
VDEHWFSPKNLNESQAKWRSSDPLSMHDGNGGGDFSGYARVNRGEGLLGSGIEAHNLVNCATRVRVYKHIVGSRRSKIADIGCGLGFLSMALMDVFAANVDGYEVSLDAVEFAKSRWAGPRFFCQAIEPSVPLGRMYDLIVAQEFYPFTRTADCNLHLGYLDSLRQSLSQGGVLLVGLSEGTNDSILSNIGKLRAALGSSHVEISRKRIPFDKVYKAMPVYAVANFVSHVISFVLKKPRFCVLLIKRV